MEKINGVKVKGLTHAYELLYPENMPEYVVIELKNGERPLVFEGKAMETANKRISKTYNIPKNARLDSSIPGRQSGRNTTPAVNRHENSFHFFLRFPDIALRLPAARSRTNRSRTPA